ncbi:MAG: DUF4115 domain-containing protein [Microcoleaceae cyanobacterium MO_207.B10]|nr:DUF4115 domain-containing protein [Microcoleaceae cyanobacterium MO_207.B10]
MVNFTGIKKIKNSLFFLPLKKEFKQEKKLSFEEEQNQALKDIGRKLKRFREKHSICLERVAVVTMIRINLLQAIEEGDLTKLPEPVYIQGLIKRYADTMGLNGEQLAEIFPAQKKLEIRKQFPLHSAMANLQTYHLYLLYLFIIILSVSSLHNLMSGSDFLGRGISSNNSSKQENQPKNQDDLVAQASSGQTTIQQKTTIKENSNKQNNHKSVVVSLIVKEDSWVSVEIDGKIEFEGTLSPGTKKTWEAKKQLILLAGNAGGILIDYQNGQTMKLGKTGAVEEVVFTATDTQISQSPNPNN